MVQASESDQLLQRIRAICRDDHDPVTLSAWRSLTVEQLRTIVVIADDGGIQAISEQAGLPQTRGHCFLLQTLVDWFQRFPYPYNPRNAPRHPITNLPITETQYRLVYEAYRRITGRDARPRPPPLGDRQITAVTAAQSPPQRERRNNIIRVVENAPGRPDREIHAVLYDNADTTVIRTTKYDDLGRVFTAGVEERAASFGRRWSNQLR